MLKILGLGAALLIIIATLSVGTFAYFNDVETVSGNSIAAGTLELSVTNMGVSKPISLSNKKPGDSGNAAIWKIENTGSITGTLKLTFGAITESEGTSAAMQTKSADATPAAGELGDYVKIAVWLDANVANGTIDNGEVYITHDGVVNTWAGGTLAVSVANTPALYEDLKDWDLGVTTGNLATIAGPATAGNFRVEYDFVENHDLMSTNPSYPTLYRQNKAQGDGATWGIIFTLAQDIVAPVLSTATVENAQPTKIVLTYNESIKTTSVPAITDFTIGGANAGGRTVTNVAIAGTQVTLTMSSAIVNGNVITISYTAGTAPIQDISGNNAANLVGNAVTNNVAP